MRVLVTGATGFVGRALIDRLTVDGHTVMAGSRSRPDTLPAGAVFLPMNHLGPGPVLAGSCRADVVVHVAARVHVMHDRAVNPLALFRTVNVEGALSVAREARAAGAGRFVYLSSLKVLGESSAPGRPLRFDDRPAPTDPYGTSKLEAERALAAFCEGSGMELVIVRPPLVYGPGVKANFHQLMAAVAKRVPLPLGAIRDNRRSLVAIDNLVDLLASCVVHRAAPGSTYLVSDGEDLSTADLVRRLGIALDVPAVLVPVPVRALEFVGRVTGRRAAVERLCGTLQVDIDSTRRAIDWQPRTSVDDALRRTASWYRSQECE